MVRVARERVHAVDALRPADRAIDVDLARAAGQRAQEVRVEVHSSASGEELHESVARVGGHPRGEEAEVERELHESFCELVQALQRLDVEEAGEVDGEERAGERDREGSGPRHPPVVEREPVERERGEEEDRQDVGERDRPSDRPVHLLEGDAEDRGEEEEARHGRLRSSRARSSARARRSSRPRSSGASGVPFSPPACQRVCKSRSAASIASTSPGGTTTPAPASRTRSAAAPSGGTAARIGRSAARYSNTFPEGTAAPRPGTSGRSRSKASESRWKASDRRRGT